MAHRYSFVLIATALLVAGCGQSDRGLAGADSQKPADKTPPRADAAPPSLSVNGADSHAPADKASSGEPAQAEESADPTAPKPLEVIGRMIKAYHGASTYADTAQVRVDVEREGQADAQPKLFDCSVTLQRPNKVQVHSLDATIIGDGKSLHAWIASLANQVLEIQSPDKLHIQDLFAGDALVDSLTQGPAGLPLQLVLLLEDDPLPALVPGGSKLTLLPTDTYDGHICRRVKVDTPDGARVFWIDSESYVLRLLELPTDALRKQLEAGEPVKRVKVVVEFVGARLNEPVPDVAFQFEVPKEAKLVKQLIGPAPQPPSDLLGQAIGDFNFTGLDGKAANRQSLAGKVAVIEFWATDSPPCRQALTQLNQVRQKYKQSDRVVFLAVNIDGPEADDQVLLDVVKQWGLEMPIHRDTAEVAYKAFHVAGSPTLIVLGADGLVQDHEVGVNPDLLTELPATIDAVLGGKATWQAAKDREQSLVDDYERKSQQPVSMTVAPLQVAKIVPHDEPSRLRLTKLWTTTELKSPGNFMIVPDAKDAARQQIFVLDGSRAVVELDRTGKVVARHALEIPPDEPVAFLRTATDHVGKRYFAASASSPASSSNKGQQQAFLFDADWKLLVAYPAADEPKHAGIADVVLADLDGKGQPVIAIGYFGQVGVQGVSLDGKRLWTNRETENVFRLAAGGQSITGKRTLLCTSSAGGVTVIDAKGNREATWTIRGVNVDTLATDELEPGRAAICGLGENTGETPLALGIGPSGEDLWRYVMPRGLHATPIERIATANLLGKNSPKQWLLAGADGSIHIIAADGTPVDHFHYGKALNGLAGAVLPPEAAAGEPQAVLLIATAGAIDAWAVTPDATLANTPHSSK